MSSDFERLISQHSGRIWANARRYGDGDVVDDLYQEILEQLWRSFERFRVESRPETWIFRIGLNTAMTRLRKRVRRRKGSDRLRSQISVESAHGGRSQANILRDFLDSLSEVDASIMMMYLDGLSGQEMADILGIRTNTIQVRINRMKKMFTDRFIEVK